MTCELFIGNLNPDARMRDLENCFGRYGKIVRSDLKRTFAFIQFQDRRDAEEAIRKENNRKLLGSMMTVEWAKGSVGDKPGFQKHQSTSRTRLQSPPRYPNKPRDRSPFGRRERSPPGRRDFSDRRPPGGRDYFDRPNFDNRQSRDRGPPRERFGNNDRFSDRHPPADRGNRGGDRDNGFNDRDRRERRTSFNGERRSFGSGPRRF